MRAILVLLALIACQGDDDLDDDGVARAQDCDDLDPSVGLASLYYADADFDGFGDAATGARECEPPPNHVRDATDCDDADPYTHPEAAESCNERDDDCDELVDEGASTVRLYVDGDGDGYGGEPRDVCAPEDGLVDNAQDCDDTDAAVHPGATEYCNDVDDNCNSAVDDGATDTTRWYTDNDGDGWGSDTSSVYTCDQPANGVDRAGDCKDNNPDIHPEAVETCNGVDDDCDGEIDLDAEGAAVWYYDDDHDDLGDPETAVVTCTGKPSGFWVLDGTDCDDTDASVLGPETWYGDADGDGFGDDDDTLDECEQPSGYVADGGDCDDTDGSVFPGEGC